MLIVSIYSNHMLDYVLPKLAEDDSADAQNGNGYQYVAGYASL